MLREGSAHGFGGGAGSEAERARVEGLDARGETRARRVARERMVERGPERSDGFASDGRGNAAKIDVEAVDVNGGGRRSGVHRRRWAKDA